jgi:hypothetical protein
MHGMRDVTDAELEQLLWYEKWSNVEQRKCLFLA